MADEESQKNAAAGLAEQMMRVLKHFAPGGPMGPIEDFNEYEKLRESLPPLERELNLRVTELIQLVEYYGRRGSAVGRDVTDAMKAAASLPVEERITCIREMNQGLMKRLGDAGQNSQFRM
ncbi:MAG TPA: hypothetical protein VFK06_14310 [Candidatus Angelobacter sp.]|nr:hypothetical protein [Candidatus Angelobacter sp.]